MDFDARVLEVLEVGGVVDELGDLAGGCLRTSTRPGFGCARMT